MPPRRSSCDVFLSHRRHSRPKSGWSGYVTRRQSTLNGLEIADFESAREASVISYDYLYNSLI
jgi:hypothetical protein